MKRIEEILIQCIEDIKAGKASLTDCLERYPDMRQELEPLLRIALSIKEPSDIKPSDAFKVRARVNLMDHIYASQSKQRSIQPVQQASFRHFWSTGWARAVAISVVVILCISAAGTGTAYASQSSLPGDTLYSVKLGTEQLQRLVTFDDTAEIELELKFADTRLNEMESIAAKRPDKISIVISGYEKSLDLAISKAEQTIDIEISLETVALSILDHLTKLDNIEDSVPEYARASIRNTRQIAINNHMETVQNLAMVNLVKATEINLKAIEGRLERARIEAERGNHYGLENALQEYERLRRFSDEISDSVTQTGHDTLQVIKMNAQSAVGQLTTLGSIYTDVPQEMKEAIEQTMGAVVGEYGQAVNKLQEQNALGEMPLEPPLSDDIPDEVQNNIRQQGYGGSGNDHK